MPPPRSPLALAASVALAVALAGSAGAAPAVHDTSAGRALARAALLKRADLGHGWSAGPLPSSVPPLTCSAFSPALRGTVETGAATSPAFRAGSGSEVVSQTSYVYATPAQAASVAAAVMKSKLLGCVAQSLVNGSSHGVHFTVSKKRMFSLGKIGAKSAGYRVSGTATRSDQIVNAYLDVVVLAHGQTVTAISFASLEQPFATGMELRLARAVVRRIRAH